MTLALDTASTLDTASDPFSTVEFADFLTEVRARRAEIEKLRHVPADLMARMKAVGVHRAIVAKNFGGWEVSLKTFLRMLERLSAADGSTGWVASFGGTTYLAALPPHRIAELYANGPDVAFAGGLHPAQPAKRVPGGLQIKGRWNFASGCMGADLIGVGVTVEGDPVTASGAPIPRLVVLKPEQVKIVDNWHVVGLCGTGSHDIVVDDIVVSEEWSFVRGQAASTLPQPIFRFPMVARAALFHSTVGMGIARAALDEFVASATDKRSITGAPPPVDRAYVQRGFAIEEARLRSARAFLYEQVDAAWKVVSSGGEVDVAGTNLLRLAAINAAEVAAGVTQEVCKLAGTGSAGLSNPLQRFMRDAHVVNLHAFLGERHLESAGRIMFGMKPLAGYP